MAYRHYSFACITCERAAVVEDKHNADYVADFRTMSRTRDQYPFEWIDAQGFQVCAGDSIFATICESCERERRNHYRITNGSTTAPAPYLNQGMLREWRLRILLSNKNRAFAKLGQSNRERPVLKIALIKYLMQQHGFRAIGFYVGYYGSRPQLADFKPSAGQEFFQR
ncbi:MAG: hypothetical protein M1828_005884 [Chrysothrix sp. TS-e1954]|nr:MAG: hypothetical protein M1828_005884 [Chrysothrix sp. TS-e1954]